MPRFLARAINFLIEASFKSMSGASPPSASMSGVSFFAIKSVPCPSRLIAAGEGRQPVLQSCTRLDQALLFPVGLVGEIPLQRFRRMLQGRFHLLCRGNDLDGGRKIAAGAPGIGVAAGEGKAHGGANGFSARRSVCRQYGGEAVTIKRRAAHGEI